MEKEHSTFDIESAIQNIDRKAFCSEADFRFSLARSIEEEYRKDNVKVICEYPFEYFDESKTIRIRMDIVVVFWDELIPIELKYRTKHQIINEINNGTMVSYELRNQSAYDAGCYGFLKDIYRVDKFLKEKAKHNNGYAVFLTNDKYYKNGISAKSFHNYDINNIKKELLDGTVNGIKTSVDLREIDFPPSEWNELNENGFYYKIVEIKG